MSILLVVVLVQVFSIQLLSVSYDFGVYNGSNADVDEVELISDEIKFSRELGILPINIYKNVGVVDKIPTQALIKWRCGNDQFSKVVPIPKEVRQRVVRGSRLYVLILDDGKAAAYVELFNPKDLTKRTYYPPEYAPKPKDNK